VDVSVGLLLDGIQVPYALLFQQVDRLLSGDEVLQGVVLGVFGGVVSVVLVLAVVVLAVRAHVRGAGLGALVHWVWGGGGLGCVGRPCIRN